MGRRFGGTTDSITMSTTASLAGFNYTFGTIAAEINFQSVAAANSGVMVTNLGVANCADMYVAGTTNRLGWFDGTNFRESTIVVPLNETIFIAITKATGTATPRAHMWRPGTNAWSHIDTGGTSPNAAATTHLMMGDSTNTIPLSAEIFQIAAWQGVAMTDSQVERLMSVSLHNWARFEPGFYARFDQGRDAGDMSFTSGRNRVRQTSRSGTTRGTIKAPAGFGSLATTRRR